MISTVASRFRPIFIFCFFILLIISISCTSSHKDSTQRTLVIFHAGSLSMPMKMLKDSFERMHPEIRIFTESAGSVASARKITELGKRCDILAVADYAVIEDMMIPKFATWNFKFASNEMALVYRKESRYADQVNSGNIFSILQKEDVVYGRSDPDADPCGYRTVLCLKLAEKRSGETGFADKLLSRHTRHIRPKEVDLLALLESGTIDYAFLYRSVAIQHHLPFVTLPDSINLKSPALHSWYQTVDTKIKAEAPGKYRIIKGEPMVYSLCIPSNAMNAADAMLFIRFLTDPEGGMKIIEESGQPSVIPAATASYSALPDELKAFALPEK